MNSAELSSSTIQYWLKRVLININVHKYHQQDGSPKQREIAHLRENLQKSGELIRHSIYDRSPLVAKRKQFDHS